MKSLAKVIFFFFCLGIMGCKTAYYQIPDKINQLKVRNIEKQLVKYNISKPAMHYLSSYDGKSCLELRNQNLRKLKIPKNYKGTLIVRDYWEGPNDYSPKISCNNKIFYKDSIYVFQKGTNIDKFSYSRDLYHLIIYDNFLSNSDTFNIDPSSIFNNDYMLIKEGKVKKYFNIRNDVYYYLAKGEKEFNYKEYDMRTLIRSGEAKRIKDSLIRKYKNLNKLRQKRKHKNIATQHL